VNLARRTRWPAASLIVVIALLAWGGIGSTGIPASASTPHASTSTLTIGTTEEPDTLNPLTTQLVTAFSVIAGVMEGMIGYNSSDHIIYRLATGYNVSKNGLVYTWHLRHGVSFQDGEPFNAKVVYDNWKAIMNSKFGAYSQQGWDHITKIKMPDKYTVVMYTKQKYAPFAYYVGSTYLSPPKAFQSPKYDQQTFGRAPVGTGPYTFVKWVSGQYIELKRNPHYWGGLAHIPTIIYKIVPNDNTLMVLLKTHNVQMTPYLDALHYSQVKAMPGLRLVTKPSFSWYHIDLKNIGFLRDTKVRLALAYATPIKEIIARILHGLASPDPTDFPPASPYLDPHISIYPYNLAKAAKLLKSDGFKKGPNGTLEKGGKPFTIEYWIPSGEQQESEVQQVVSASWQKLGINVTDHQQDINSIWGPNGYQFNRKMTGGAYSWFNSNDPDDSFYWNSKDIPKTPTSSGGDAVEYYFKYPWQAKIDRLTNQGVATINPAQRKKIYWKVQQLLHQQEPVVFMYSQKNIYATPSNMKGFAPSAYNDLLWNVQDWRF